MSKYLVIPLGFLLLPVLLGSCINFKIPSTEEIEQVFAPEAEPENMQEVVPASVPKLDASDLGGWRLLCDECHVGPSYSSHRILHWGHRESCIEHATCLGCHGKELHRMDVRGNKKVCYDCHLSLDVPTQCSTCHAEEHVDLYTPHPPQFLGNHGDQKLVNGFECSQCHGSESWCLDCHGLPMPHPENIIEQHQEIVQGQPEVCTNCHGRMSCIRCHYERGIEITN